MAEQKPVDVDDIYREKTPDVPMTYVEKYLDALVKQPRDFVFLRQSVSRSSQLATIKPVRCRINKRNDLTVALDGGMKSFPINTFENISWGQLESSSSGTMKFINISLKGDRNPIILHGPTEIMELWFDALRIKGMNKKIDTNSSKNKNEMFTKATTFASMSRKLNVEIPPLPENYNFTCDFSDD